MRYAWINREIMAGSGYDTIMRRFQLAVISEALEITNGNKSRAARLLKVSRNNFARWAKHPLTNFVYDKNRTETVQEPQ